MTPRRVRLALLCLLIHIPTAAAAQDTTTTDSTRGRPLLSRDRFTAAATIGGALLSRLPIDDPRQALVFLPGVVVRGAALGPDGAVGPAIRGGPDGEAAVYIDGAPARFQLLGTQGITLGLNAVYELSLVNGVADIALADARSGVVSYVTPIGGSRIAGHFRAQTDQAFGNGSTVGFHRFEGSAGGPVPGTRGLRWFAAGDLQGQQSPYRGLGAAEQPTYVPAGLDTTVQVTDGAGNAWSVDVPRFAQWSGDCDACLGLRRPMDWTSNIRLMGKVQYDLGAGSSVAVTGLAAGRQDRFYPGSLIGAPSLYQGQHAWSRLVVANLRHEAGPRGTPLVLHANLSWGIDRAISGPLESTSERETREPGLGIELGTLRFAGLELFPFPITEEIVRNFRSNTGLRAPYLDRGDLWNSQPYRLNPFGLASGWPTTGLDATLTLLSERRLHGRAHAEWMPGLGHRLTLGLDGDATDLSFFSSSLVRQAYATAVAVEPRTFGVFAADRLTLGDAELYVGLRYDRVNPGGEFADVPGRIHSHPAWDSADYTQAVANVMTEARTQTALSPRVRFAYHAGVRTTVRLAAGRHLEAPPYAQLFADANNDLSFTNTNDTFGRDVDFARVTLVEAGVEHAFPGGVALGLSGYRKTPGTPYAFRLQPYADPLNVGDTLLVNALTMVDDGDVIGLDAALAWQHRSGISVWTAYSLASVRFDDLPGPAGVVFERPAVTTQQVSLLVSAIVPDGWRRGTTLGKLAEGLEGTVVFRAVSGLPYTRLRNQGAGCPAPGSTPFCGTQIEPLNASQLPWTKHLDLRVTRHVRAGRMDWTVYADVRNVLGFRNTETLFAETGDVRNDLHRATVLSPEYENLRNEASINGALMTGGTVDVRGCGAWVSPVNCVALSRVERRFGDGDGLYSQVEQDRALNAYYDSFFGQWAFLGPGRTARVGLEVRF